MRLFATLFFAGVLSSQAGDILFQDTFDRTNNRNIDAVLTGVTENTGSSLAADAVYSQPWLDPNNKPPTYGVQDGIATNGGGAQILSNRLQLATGSGTSNAYVNHNFINPEILTASGFSVSIDVASYPGTDRQQGGGFAIGMSAAEAASASDASDISNPSMTGAFAYDPNGFFTAPVGANIVSDFWVALRGNNSFAWGSSTGVVLGVGGLAANTGTITVQFACSDFNSGSTVDYEVFLNGVSKGSGSFVWSGTNENYIGLDTRDGTGVNLDNFTISTWSPAPSVEVSVSPDVVAQDNPALPVDLTWSGLNIPAGATYEITGNKAVNFPSGGDTGSATNSGDMVAAEVNGTLGKTIFTLTVRNASSQVIATATATVNLSGRPNVVVILVDDLGWGDLGCYGSEIPTPNIDALAGGGVRFRQFYNSARCSPTRCSLLTGVYPQQAAVNPSDPLPNLSETNNSTFAETLGGEGYRTYMAGKWHLGSGARLPENRGFQHVFRFANGDSHSENQWNQSLYTLVSQNNEIAFRDYAGTGGTFYQTDAIGDYTVDFINHDLAKGDGTPFAIYMAFGAPHFPIGAPAALADTYMATYSQGWDVIRQARYDNQLAIGVIDSRYPFPALGGTGPHQSETIEAIPAWNTLAADRRADLTRRMALYAAMIQKVDDNIGKVVTRLTETGQLDNTLILFMSDNGANHESGVFGSTSNNGATLNGPLTGTALTNMGQAGANDAIHYGGGWAHVCNTPLKLFKHFTHEGGIRAPLIVHWPDGFTAQNVWNETPTHLVDIAATVEDATGADHPAAINGHSVLPLEGISLMPLLVGQPVPERPIFVEHESNRMIRKGKWKLVTEAFTAFDNEFNAHQRLLYDMDLDPGESTDLAAANPAKVIELVDEWNAWATRVGLPSGNQIVPPPDNLTPAPSPADLFLDTFNRPDATAIDAASDGMSGSRVPPLGAGAAWFEGFEGSSPKEPSIQVIDSVLQMATGVGMSESGINHNFIGQDILDAGGFSLSLRVLNINSTAGDDEGNRYAGFGVGLNATQAASGNDYAQVSPPPFRGLGGSGVADCFVELDLTGHVKLWIDGSVVSSVDVGAPSGTLTAAFECASFASGATVTVSVFFNGERLDLDSGSAAMTRNFVWDETDANYLGLSARATSLVQMDNFAVRKLPVATALSIEHALGAGLDGAATDLSANPDGDKLNNFGEWAFGTDPTRSDDEVSATSLLLVESSSNTFRFAHRRLSDFQAVGLNYDYLVSENLTDWTSVTPIEESATALPASAGYEAVTLQLPVADVANREKLFLRIAAH